MEIDFLGVGRNTGFPDAKEEEEEDGAKDSTTPGKEEEHPINHEMKLSGLSHPSRTIMNAPVIQSLPPVLNSTHFPAGHTSIFPSSRQRIGATICRDTNAPKSSGSPAQLTIFFGGSVYVYDDVSPNKAQAIMSLARSSSSASPSKPVSMTRVQTQQVNTQQVIITPPALIPAVAIPQARNMSLARFLERRKARILKASPYSLNKSSPKQSGLPSDNLSCSAANSTEK